jgi:hypothetical protein
VDRGMLIFEAVRVLRVTMLVVGFGAACADPPRRPPVAYEPIGNATGAPLPSSVPSTASAAPSSGPSSAPQTTSASTEPSGKPSKPAGKGPPVSSADPPAPTSSADAPSLGDDTCLRKLQNGCCGKITYVGKQSGGKLVCPKGTIPHATCKQSATCK